MTPTLEATLRLDIAQYEAQLAKAKGEANKFKADLAKAQGGFGRGLLGGLAALPIAGTIAAISREAVGVVIGMDRMRRAMTTMEGSAEGAQARLAELRETAKLPGIGFEQAVQGDIRLRSVGISAEMSRRAIVEFGNALALSGGSAADLDGVVLALGQIAAKGSVSAEEINQIAERVPQIRQIMKDAFGTADTTAIQKMGLSTDAFISGLVTTMEKGKRAVAGLDESLADIEQSFKDILDASHAPVMNELIPALGELAKAAAQNREVFAGLGEVLANVVRTGMKLGSIPFAAGQMYTERMMFGEAGATEKTKRDALSLPGVEMANKTALEAINGTTSPTKKDSPAPSAFTPPAPAPDDKAIVASRRETLRLQEMENALSEKRFQDYLSILPPNLKLIELKREILTIEERMNTQASASIGEGRIENETRILDLKRMVRDAEADITEEKSKAAEKLQKELEDEARKKQQKDGALADFEREMQLINAKLAGNKQLTLELERQAKIEEQKQRLMDAGVSEQEATSKATQMVDAQQKLEDKGDKEGKIQGYSRERQGGADAARQRAADRVNASRASRDEAVRKTFGTLDTEGTRLKDRFAAEFGGRPGDPAAAAANPGANPLAPNAAKNAAAEAAATSGQTGGTAEQAAQIVIQSLPQILSTLTAGAS